MRISFLQYWESGYKFLEIKAFKIYSRTSQYSPAPLPKKIGRFKRYLEVTSFFLAGGGEVLLPAAGSYASCSASRQFLFSSKLMRFFKLQLFVMWQGTSSHLAPRRKIVGILHSVFLKQSSLLFSWMRFFPLKYSGFSAEKPEDPPTNL